MHSGRDPDMDWASGTHDSHHPATLDVSRVQTKRTVKGRMTLMEPTWPNTATATYKPGAYGQPTPHGGRPPAAALQASSTAHTAAFLVSLHCHNN